MNGLGIIALGLFAFCATAPDVPMLLLDLVHFHVEGPETLQVASCARDRAVARCVAGGRCSEQ